MAADNADEKVLLSFQAAYLRDRAVRNGTDSTVTVNHKGSGTLLTPEQERKSITFRQCQDATVNLKRATSHFLTR